MAEKVLKLKKPKKSELLAAAGLLPPSPENMRCIECRGWERCFTPFQTSEGTGKVMIVLLAPSQETDRKGKPFDGPIEQLVKKYILKPIGIRPSQVSFTYALRCSFKKSTARQIDLCSSFLRQDIERLRPDKIIGLGLEVARGLLSEKNLKLKDIVNVIHPYFTSYGSVPVLISWNPNKILFAKKGVENKMFPIVFQEQFKKFIDGEMKLNSFPEMRIL